MSRFDDLDRALAAYLDADSTAAPVPATLLDETLAVTAAKRPLPTWRARLHAGGLAGIAPGGAGADGRLLALAFTLVGLLVALLAIGLSAGGRPSTPLGGIVQPGGVDTPAGPSGEPPATASTDPSVDPGRVAIEPGDPWIVYMANVAGADSDRLWLVRPDGTDRHQLAIQTGRDGQQEHPDWSPDGSLLAFDQWYRLPDRPDLDRLELWVAAPDGTGPRLVATCEAAPCLQLAYPAFSPDGRSLAFVRFDEPVDGRWGPSAVEVVPLDGGPRRVVIESADGSVAYFTPRWSPDGARFVFGVETYADPTETTRLSAVIATVAADGSEATPTVVSPAGMDAFGPDWHPSGDRIAFATRFDPSDPDTRTVATDIWTVRPDGTDAVNLSNLGLGQQRAIEPTWTPDGRRLVFTLVDGFGAGQVPLIAFMDADGTNVSRLGFADGTAGRLRPVP